ncbi:hypothetical protein HW44_02260 [Nitrosococcus oceani]|nr:hypothetical protein HW44_02260 [Nitrosococcus oceani]
MNREERIARLKELRVERREGPLFQSANDCMQWIDNVAPLLRYDRNHYDNFMGHAEYVRVTNLSADLLMAHLNPMIGIVNQAIGELENDFEPEHDVETKVVVTSNDHQWYQKPTGLIAIGVIIVVLGACAIWILNHYFDIGL